MNRVFLTKIIYLFGVGGARVLVHRLGRNCSLYTLPLSVCFFSFVSPPPPYLSFFKWYIFKRHRAVVMSSEWVSVLSLVKGVTSRPRQCRVPKLSQTWTNKLYNERTKLSNTFSPFELVFVQKKKKKVFGHFGIFVSWKPMFRDVKKKSDSSRVKTSPAYIFTPCTCSS